MDLLEYQGKDLYRKVGLPVPKGYVVRNVVEAQEALEKLGGRAIAKVQVAAGHRGQRGGVKKVDSENLEDVVTKLLALKLDGISAEALLLEELIDIEQEMYLALMLNRQERQIELLFSQAGGMSVEEATEQSGIMRTPYPIAAKELPKIIRAIGGSKARESVIRDIIGKLEQLLRTYDALLVEVNPFVRLQDGAFMLLDSKITIDDNALYRQPELAALRPLGTKEEQAAREAGFSYVPLDGSIAVIGNGAGLVMATLDALELVGLHAANFLDVGGGAESSTMRKAVRLALQQSNIQGLFVNIFGGITQADEIANGLSEALLGMKTDVPVTVRLAGNGAAKGREILKRQNIAAYTDMDEAAKAVAVSSAKKQ